MTTDAPELRVAGRGQLPEAFGLEPTDVPGTAIETQPGDAVIFDQDVQHGSFGDTTGRRMVAVSFVANAVTPEHTRFLAEAHAATNMCLRPHPALFESASPRLRAMAARLLELGFEALQTSSAAMRAEAQA
jgi:hypothetical protein